MLCKRKEVHNKYGNRHFWCRGYYVNTVGKKGKKHREKGGRAEGKARQKSHGQTEGRPALYPGDFLSSRHRIGYNSRKQHNNGAIHPSFPSRLHPGRCKSILLAGGVDDPSMACWGSCFEHSAVLLADHPNAFFLPEFFPGLWRCRCIWRGRNGGERVCGVDVWPHMPAHGASAVRPWHHGTFAKGRKTTHPAGAWGTMSRRTCALYPLGSNCGPVYSVMLPSSCIVRKEEL